MNKDLHISSAGIALIEEFEKFVPRKYHGADDAPGVMTIGWGHKILSGEVFVEPMTREFGDALLRKDTLLAELVVKKHVNATTILSQNEFDALVSLTFNTGYAVFVNRDKSDTHLTIALNSQNMPTAADAILLFNHADGKVSNGLVRRRKEERTLFLMPALKNVSLATV